jgi:hypothetical protein
MRIERLPERTSIKSEFGEVAIEYSVSGNVLVATQAVSFAQSRIPPDKYPDFRDFVNSYIRATTQRLRVVNGTPWYQRSLGAPFSWMAWRNPSAAAERLAFPGSNPKFPRQHRNSSLLQIRVDAIELNRSDSRKRMFPLPPYVGPLASIFYVDMKGMPM